MTTVSAVMFEIVEMYIFQIHLHYFFSACCMLKQNHDFSCFRRLILSLSWKSNDQVGLKFWTCLHATVLLAVKYSVELNKNILLVRVICEKYRFRGQSNVPRRIRIFASPLNWYFSQIILTNRIYLYKINKNNKLEIK
jgi:hypothetical protein